MLFSYNKNKNFPDIGVGNNTINETSVTKFLGIHLDKKFNFVNHISKMSIIIIIIIIIIVSILPPWTIFQRFNSEFL